MRDIVKLVTGIAVAVSGLGVFGAFLVGFFSIGAAVFGFKVLHARECFEAAIGIALCGSPFLLIHRKIEQDEVEEAALAEAEAAEAAAIAATTVTSSSAASGVVVSTPATAVPPPAPVSSAGKRQKTKKQRHQQQNRQEAPKDPSSPSGLDLEDSLSI